MLTENVYYSEQPEKYYIYPYDANRMCRIDFPVNVEEVEASESVQYICDVYFLRMEYSDTLLKEIESDYEGWLEKAKKYTGAKVQKAMLKSVLLGAVNVETSDMGDRSLATSDEGSGSHIAPIPQGKPYRYLVDGVYTITYTAEDECGNETEVIRTIEVS